MGAHVVDAQRPGSVILERRHEAPRPAVAGRIALCQRKLAPQHSRCARQTFVIRCQWLKS